MHDLELLVLFDTLKLMIVHFGNLMIATIIFNYAFARRLCVRLHCFKSRRQRSVRSCHAFVKGDSESSEFAPLRGAGGGLISRTHH